MKVWVKVSEKFRHCEAAKRPKQSQYIPFIIIFAIIIKLSLFAFAAVHAPQGKMLPDSYGYLELSETLASKGVFASQYEKGILAYETFRTPGYPVFLAIFNGLMKIPLNGIVFIQIAMALLTAFITYKTALMIEPRIAFLSAAIILFDPPITIFSLTILTESLFLLLISLFMLEFTLYLKTANDSNNNSNSSRAHFSVPYRHLILSAIMLAAATYVRPVSYYLGFALPFFILYVNRHEGLWKGLKKAIIFLVALYSIIGLWQVRNYIRCNEPAFSSAGRENLTSKGLFNSFARNRDPYTKGMAPFPYYINVSARCVMSIMTRPGNMKYFGSDMLTAIGKAFAYPWMIFWLAGFIWGVFKAGRNVCVHFMLIAVIYFIAASIAALTWDVSERLRVSIMPFIAIISAYGWVNLLRHCEPAKGG